MKRTEKQQRAWDEWLADRPECVRRLAEEFPIGVAFLVGDSCYYLIGYTESDILICSKTDPRTNYDVAIANPEYIHADCVRGAVKAAIV